MPLKSLKRLNWRSPALIWVGHQVVDDRLGMDFLLDVDRHHGNGQSWRSCFVLAPPDELRIERLVARISIVFGACSSSAMKSRSSSVGMFVRLSLWRIDSTLVSAGVFLPCHQVFGSGGGGTKGSKFSSKSTIFSVAIAQTISSFT